MDRSQDKHYNITIYLRTELPKLSKTMHIRSYVSSDTYAYNLYIHNNPIILLYNKKIILRIHTYLLGIVM